MSPQYAHSLRRDILLHCFDEDVLANPAIQHVKLAEIDLSADDRRQLVLRLDDLEATRLVRRPGIELHQHIHVAPLGIEVGTHHRSEERQPPHAPFPSVRRQPLVRTRYRYSTSPAHWRR